MLTKFPCEGSGFRWRDSGLYAPEPTAIPIAPLQPLLCADHALDDPGRSPPRPRGRGRLRIVPALAPRRAPTLEPGRLNPTRDVCPQSPAKVAVAAARRATSVSRKRDFTCSLASTRFTGGSIMIAPRTAPRSR